MTPEEFEFVNAFVQLTEEEVTEWHGRANDYEKERIFDLIQEYREQLVLKNILLDNYKITDLSDAKEVIRRVR